MTWLQLVVSNRRDNIPELYALDSKMVKHLKLNNYHNSMKSLLSIVEKFVKAKDRWTKNPRDNETAGSCCDCVRNSIMKIKNSRNITLIIRTNEL